jgi:hypothetical protein
MPFVQFRKLNRDINAVTNFINFNAEMCCMLRVKNHHYEKMASTIVNRFPKGKRYVVFVALAVYFSYISDS